MHLYSTSQSNKITGATYCQIFTIGTQTYQERACMIIVATSTSLLKHNLNYQGMVVNSIQ